MRRRRDGLSEAVERRADVTLGNVTRRLQLGDRGEAVVSEHSDPDAGRAAPESRPQPPPAGCRRASYRPDAPARWVVRA